MELEASMKQLTERNIKMGTQLDYFFFLKDTSFNFFNFYLFV